LAETATTGGKLRTIPCSRNPHLDLLASGGRPRVLLIVQSARISKFCVALPLLNWLCFC
jgi:hypothetical protein